MPLREMKEIKTDFGWEYRGSYPTLKWVLRIYDSEPTVAYLDGIFADMERGAVGPVSTLEKIEAIALDKGCSEIIAKCEGGKYAYWFYKRHGYCYVCDDFDRPYIVWMKKEFRLDEMAYPKSFDMEEFKAIRTFSKRVDYCRSRLKYLGRGSSRMVFEIDNEKVLKLAYNNKGIAQNKVEADPAMTGYYGIFAKVYDMHKNYHWIEMEKAAPATEEDFDEIYGGDFGLFSDFFKEWRYDLEKDFTKGGIFNDWLCPYVRYLYSEARGTAKGDAWHEFYNMFENTDEYKGSLFNGIRDYMYDWDLNAHGDLRRINSYGIVERNGKKKIVIIDYGLNNDVYNRYYVKRKM